MNPIKWQHLLYTNLSGDLETVLDDQPYNSKGTQTLRCILSAPKNTLDWMRPRKHDGSFMEHTPDTILAAMCGVSKHHESRNFEHQYLKILNVKEHQHPNVQESE